LYGSIHLSEKDLPRFADYIQSQCCLVYPERAVANENATWILIPATSMASSSISRSRRAPCASTDALLFTKSENGFPSDS
jgi:hypothetical protein